MLIYANIIKSIKSHLHLLHHIRINLLIGHDLLVHEPDGVSHVDVVGDVFRVVRDAFLVDDDCHCGVFPARAIGGVFREFYGFHGVSREVGGRCGVYRELSGVSLERDDRGGDEPGVMLKLLGLRCR